MISKTKYYRYITINMQLVREEKIYMTKGSLIITLNPSYHFVQYLWCKGATSLTHKNTTLRIDCTDTSSYAKYTLLLKDGAGRSFCHVFELHPTCLYEPRQPSNYHSPPDSVFTTFRHTNTILNTGGVYA